MDKKKQVTTPITVPLMSFGDVIKASMKKREEDGRFVKKTGLCASCKKNPVRPGFLDCTKCSRKIEKLIKQCQGPGFSAFSL